MRVLVINPIDKRRGLSAGVMARTAAGMWCVSPPMPPRGLSRHFSIRSKQNRFESPANGKIPSERQTKTSLTYWPAVHIINSAAPPLLAAIINARAIFPLSFPRFSAHRNGCPGALSSRRGAPLFWDVHSSCAAAHTLCPLAPLCSVFAPRGLLFPNSVQTETSLSDSSIVSIIWCKV